jgi:uncharacterized protein YdaU (DUF1376 family)
LERALYRELLDELYDSERPLPESVEKLSDLLGLEKASEISALRTVLRKKFVILDGGWIQARAWSEILAYNEFRDKRRAAGKEGGRSKHRRLLEQKLASASKCQPDAKQNLASLDTISQIPDPVNHSPSPSEPAVPGELAAGGTQGGPELRGDRTEGSALEAPDQRQLKQPLLGVDIEFPTGWPDSAERAVSHVRSLMLPVQLHGPPHEDWVKEVWLQAVGRNFCDGAQVRIVQFAHWVHGRWSKEGQEWLARREASKPREKKEGAGLSPSAIKEPEFPWQKVVFAEWGYIPTVPWEQQTARKRREIEAAWVKMPAERRKEVEALVLPEEKDGQTGEDRA